MPRTRKCSIRELREPDSPVLQVRACNMAYNSLSNTLVSDVSISPAFQGPTRPADLVIKPYEAIWDTGATNSVVSQTIVNDCGLQPIGVTTVKTAGGERLADTYLVGIWLPNRICIPSLRVTQGVIGDGKEALIGMDIICQGDFAVTNKDGKTNFTFRMPSLECIDFVKQKPPIVTDAAGNILRRPGRNEPCYCGSGKKFKKCHGA